MMRPVLDTSTTDDPARHRISTGVIYDATPVE